jgi:hypothetical protein
MGVTAIIVDGSDRPLVGRAVVIEPERVGRRPRPWLAIGLALLTAVVAIGAAGPRAQSDASRCAREGSMAVGTVVVTASPPVVAPAPLRTVVVWTPWREWVDPDSGETVRVARDPGGLVRLLRQRLGPVRSR